MNIKAVIFDADGMVIHNSHAQRFSVRFAKKYGVKEELILPFFKNEFQECLAGRADLKEELKKYVKKWNWQGTIDELLEFWFVGEDNPDERVLTVARELKTKDIICCLATNNEKYRTEYIIERMKLGSEFNKVYSSAYLGFKKPETKFYQYIVDDLGLIKDEVLFWDDEAEELEAVTKQGFIFEKYMDFDSFKNKIAMFGLL